MSTVPVIIPTSAVEAIQKGASVHGYAEAFRDVREAILATDLPAPADPPGTVYSDPDGDLWIVGPNGKVGLLIIDADPGYGDRQTVSFCHEGEGFFTEAMEEDGWSVAYVPGTTAEVTSPTVVRDCEGDLWERASDGTYTVADGSIDGYTYAELAEEYPKGYGPLEVLA